jgi:hypothetical protein
MRQYEIIWKRLKGPKNKVEISSPRHYHRRIIRAVKKEKYKDIVYKFELSEQGRTAKLLCMSFGPVITFELKIEKTQITLEDI